MVDEFLSTCEVCAKYNVRKGIVTLIGHIPIPDLISSDNGSAFIQKTVKQGLQQLRIKQRLGCVYRPQSQGSVERVNGVIKAKIDKIC